MKKFLIFIVFLFLGIVVVCNFNSVFKGKEIDVITPTRTIALTIPEPSGLYYDASDNTLWTVSDEVSNLYNIDMDGNIIKTIKVDGRDLEGITKFDESTFVTILERERTVVFMDTSGFEKKRFTLDLKGEENKGLEGISFKSSSNTFYILNEKEPRLLIELDTNGNVVNNTKLSSVKDYSGIHYDEANECLWITSDEDEMILKTNLKGDVLSRYKTNIEQIEGIAIDNKNSKLFLVSDPLEKLFIFDLP